MTEHEWLTSEDPRAMLEFLRGKVSDRKSHLFHTACCRRIHGRTARLLAEARAEHPTTPLREVSYGREGGSYLRFAIGATEAAEEDERGATPAWGKGVAAADIIRYAAHFGDEASAQVRSARCVFGNPFRPVTPDPSWLTSDVVGLATAIYDARAFNDLPILADALQDAGCDDEAVLAHCRGEGPHARGCFVVDMLTGRA